MKFAVIDIGSNTAKAEIYKYKDGVLELKDKYVETDMIADHKDGGVLDREGVDILINIMNRFRVICAENGINRIFPYATQSLRGITNADDVINRIKKRTGLDVNIISGEEEARLCFESFIADGGAEHGVLSDMGGGSTELSFINGGRLVKSVSLPFGSRSLCHDLKIDLIPDKEQEKRIADIINGYKNTGGLPAGMQRLFACGGSCHGMFRLYDAAAGSSADVAGLDRLKAFYAECKADRQKAEAAAKKLTPERYDTVYTGIFAHIILASALGCSVINRCKSTCRKGYAAKLVKDGYIK